MPAVDLDYTRDRPRALEGTLADIGLCNLISRHADVAIPFGKTLVQGANDRSVKLPTAGGVFMGVSVRDQGVTAYSPNGFAAGDDVRILETGVINVKLAGTVTAGVGAAFLDTNGGFVAAGTASSTGIVKGRYERGGVAGDIVELRLG